MLQRKHYCTQQLFSLQFKPIKHQSKVDQRHAEDAQAGVMEYQVEGSPDMFFETKGLRHDCMGWGVRGNPQVRESCT